MGGLVRGDNEDRSYSGGVRGRKNASFEILVAIRYNNSCEWGALSLLAL